MRRPSTCLSSSKVIRLIDRFRSTALTDRTQSPIALPSRMGRYILLSRLTEGGMTEVYAAKSAEEVGPGRILVVKVLPMTATNDPDAESRFLEEARIVLNLTHGNITAAFEFARDGEGRPFLVMEYVPGPSLRRLRAAAENAGDVMDVSDVLFVAGEVCKALSYAHGFAASKSGPAGIIHRDISPDNIVLSTAGQVKLTDFGIAELVRSRAVGPIMGKPAYIAPETAAGRAPSIASDLYSLGAVLYECLTGRPPFKGETDKETLTLSATETPLPPSALRRDIPEALDSLIRSLLEKDPKQRPKSAAEVEIRIRTMLRQAVPSYTESDLARTIGEYFDPAAFQLSETREAIRAALAGAGISLTGTETTGDLLNGGTVPLSSPAPSQGKVPEKMHGFRRSRRTLLLLLAAGVVLAFAILQLGQLRLSEPPPTPDPAPSDWTEAQRRDTETNSRDDVRRPPTTDAAASVAALPPNTPEAAPPTSAEAGPESEPPKAKGAKNKGRGAKSAAKTPPQDAEFGWLNINSYPWSYVSVDGDRLDGHTPYRRVKLRAGAHTLIFENPELKLKTVRKVTVSAWEETNVGVRMK